MLNPEKKCLDCGTDMDDAERFYCDAFCAMRSTAAIPPCGDLLCSHQGHVEGMDGYREAK